MQRSAPIGTPAARQGDAAMTAVGTDGYVRAARLDDIGPEGCSVVRLGDHTVAIFRHEDGIYAVDNRCPHMGFPLNQGSVQCGILTCHWHHARFDLATGGTFDPWADDVRSYPVLLRDEEVWVDLSPPAELPIERYRSRLERGMEQNLRLIVAKAVIGLHASNAPAHVPLEVGAEQGILQTRNGWGAGLTILTAMGSILPALAPVDRPLALFHGLTHVAANIAGQPPAIAPEPLPRRDASPGLLKRWLREMVDVRDRDGAERVLATAADSSLPEEVLADMVFSAASDHLSLDGGHTLDFCNKAMEMLDQIGWDHASLVLPSLAPVLTRAQRSEELASWRRPIDLTALLKSAFAELPAIISGRQGMAADWKGRAELTQTVLGDDPAKTTEALKQALSMGATPLDLASAVSLAAAHRIAAFRISNEFGDWVTVLHTFAYANAVEQAVRRAPSIELLRSVFDAAMSVYLDRFLNTPPVPLPQPRSTTPPDPAQFLRLLDSQQRVAEAGQFVADWMGSGRTERELLQTLGSALLREDAEFHTFQMVEAAFRQWTETQVLEERRVFLLAAARYLAAHAPTSRAAGQTYQIALRMHRGEELYNG